jgi:RimJ/RimL family protein N-acetyltransferase
MRIMPLGAADVPAYRALMLHAYASAPDAFTSTPEERAAAPDAWWLKRVADPAGLGLAFGAFDGGELVGTVALELSARPKTRHKAVLIGMFVHESKRGRGTGRALVEAALRYARSQPQLTSMTLTVSEGNARGVGLYERCGFAAFGTEPMAILTPAGYKAKIHMWLRLREEAPAR